MVIMSFAVIKTGGKQYRVIPGQVLTIEKLVKPTKDDKIVFDEVLLVDDGKTTKIGTPIITSTKVSATFLEEGRAKKVTTIKFKSKSNYKKKLGHRQPFTKVKIDKIG